MASKKDMEGLSLLRDSYFEVCKEHQLLSAHTEELSAHIKVPDEDIESLRRDNAALKERLEVVEGATARIAELALENSALRKSSSDITDDLLAKLQLIEKLKARLEVVDGAPDGIECRDETIRGLEKDLRRLERENQVLKNAGIELIDRIDHLEGRLKNLDEYVRVDRLLSDGVCKAIGRFMLEQTIDTWDAYARRVLETAIKAAQS